MNRLIGFAALAAMLAIGCVDQSNPGSGTDDDDGVPLPDAGPGNEDGSTLADLGDPCEPTSETCNGEDDDCDDLVDEDFSIGEACTLSEGDCTSDGLWACAEDGMGAICDAPAPEPADEMCNALDDDCDGESDEDFDLTSDTAHCGGCGMACALPNAEPACAASVCGIASCLEGFADPDGLADNGCECAISDDGVEDCDGIDDDCDGEIDEGLGLGEACSVGLGACAADGVTVCGDDGGVACGAEPAPPSDEACNGFDDDCDGETDEGFDADGDGFPSCPVDCEGPCPAGVDCDVVCPRQDCRPDDNMSFPGAAEICEDDIDQNCDGQDISCDVPAGRIGTIAVAAQNGAGCRDIDGDGRIDNTFGNAVLTGLVNPELQSAVDDRQLNLIVLAPGLAPPGRNGIFDLGVVFASTEGADYRVNPDALDEDGLPVMLFPGAEVDNGALDAGPGTFLLSLNQGGVVADLRISNTMVTGDIGTNEAGVTVNDGWVTGYVTREDFMAILVIVPAEFRDIAALLIQPDIDTDDDGQADAYSACVEFQAAPTTLLGYP